MLQACIQIVPNHSTSKTKQSHFWIDIFVVTVCFVT